MSEDLDFTTMRWHPAAEAFEMLPEKKGKKNVYSIEELAESIRDKGLLHPIKYWQDPADGKFWKVDGRNREAACKAAGVKPRYTQARLPVGLNIVEYIQIENGDRRHLTASQKAMSAAKLVPLFKAEVSRAERARREEAGPSAPAPEGGGTKQERSAAGKAAKAAGVGARNVQDAVIIEKKDPELAEKVRKGEVTIPQAKREITRREKEEALKAAAEAVGPPAEGDTWSAVPGDAIAELEKLPSESVDLVFLDPPYNQGIDYGSGAKADKLSDDDYLAWMNGVIETCVTLMAPDGALVLVCPDEYADHLSVLLREAGLHRRAWLKWYETFGVNCAGNFNRTSRHVFYCVKNRAKFTFHESVFSRPSARQVVYNDGRAAPAGKLWDDVWCIPRLVENSRERLPGLPTQLPLELVRPLVEGLTDPGGLVVDPMMGSGTSGEAAILSGRRFYGVEKNARFCEMARQRLILAADSVARAARKAGKDKPAAAPEATPADATPEANGEATDKPKKAKNQKATEPEAEPAAV
jgi:DNA modification methylase/ParB-like chromosome segregation protein Spo0J